MKIIETRGAPNPRRVRIFLAEKQIAVPFEDRDLMQNELKTEEFTELNPMQRVPVLVLDDGQCICESVAICRYFEELQPEPALFGSGAAGRAIVEMWNRRMDLGLFFHISQVFRHLHPKMARLEVPQVPDWGEANKPKVSAILRILDHQLSANRYVSGPTFTIADITALVAVDFMKAAKLIVPAGLENLSRWHHEVSGRASASA